MNALLILSGFEVQTTDAIERRRKLLVGLHYNKGFIVTYQYALCGVLLVFTVWHWAGKLSRRRRRRRRGVSDDGASGSSSSTIEGNATPLERSKAVMMDEQTPLIVSGSGTSRTGSLSRLARKIRAIAMYQPPALSILGLALPSHATSLAVLLFLALNLFYALYAIPLDIYLAFIPADRFGLIFAANLPWLYLLAAKNQPIKLLTGYSYENLNILHRRLGEVLCLSALLHAAGMVVVWYTFLLPTGMDFWHFVMLRVIWLGLAAFVCYEVLFVSSLASFREWWYEMFLGSHIVLQAGGLGFLFFHHRGGRVYVGVALGIFLVDRVVFRVAMKPRVVKADLKVMGDGDTMRVSADWPVTSRWSKLSTTLFGLSVKYGWKPTEHIFLSVPALGAKHIVQAHPFTIASAAPEADQAHAWFNLIIRAHDGFTRDLVRYAHNHASTQVRLDGPYGSLHALEMLQASDIALLVVGGSGIAVAYPLIWTLLHERDAEAVEARRKVGLIWVVHEASHIDWIGHERLAELKERGLHMCIPGPTSKAGRPDVSTLMKECIAVMQSKALMDDAKIGVVVSGPDGMNRAARNTCASMAWEGRDVEVCVEKYGW